MIYLIAAALGGAFLIATIAQVKGRSFVWWWIYGCLLGVIALPHVLLARNLRASGGWSPSRFAFPGHERPCPNCGASIPQEALFCRHCRQFIYQSDTATEREGTRDGAAADSFEWLDRSFANVAGTSPRQPSPDTADSQPDYDFGPVSQRRPGRSEHAADEDTQQDLFARARERAERAARPATERSPGAEARHAADEGKNTAHDAHEKRESGPGAWPSAEAYRREEPSLGDGSFEPRADDRQSRDRAPFFDDQRAQERPMYGEAGTGRRAGAEGDPRPRDTARPRERAARTSSLRDDTVTRPPLSFENARKRPVPLAIAASLLLVCVVALGWLFSPPTSDTAGPGGAPPGHVGPADDAASRDVADLTRRTIPKAEEEKSASALSPPNAASDGDRPGTTDAIPQEKTGSPAGETPAAAAKSPEDRSVAVDTTEVTPPRSGDVRDRSAAGNAGADGTASNSQDGPRERPAAPAVSPDSKPKPPAPRQQTARAKANSQAGNRNLDDTSWLTMMQSALRGENGQGSGTSQEPVAASGQMVAIVQQRLKERGFNPGAVDGRAGPRTVAAVRAFQQSIGVEATGEIGIELMQNLDILGQQLQMIERQSSATTTPAADQNALNTE